MNYETKRQNIEKGTAFPPSKEYTTYSQNDYYKSGEQSQEHPMTRIDFCPEFLEKKCQKGASCKKRHILYKDFRRELKFIQQPYKKHLCKQFEMGQKCQKNKYTCLFAHGEADIWNSRFPEKAADEINSSKVDERRKSANQQQYDSKDYQMKQYNGSYEKGGDYHQKPEGLIQKTQEKRHKLKKTEENVVMPECERGNKRSKANQTNDQNRRAFEEQQRNNKRTNGGFNQAPHASDTMTNEEFDEYLKYLNQQNEEDVWVDDEENNSNSDSDEEEEEKEQKRKPASKQEEKKQDIQDNSRKWPDKKGENTQEYPKQANIFEKINTKLQAQEVNNSKNFEQVKKQDYLWNNAQNPSSSEEYLNKEGYNQNYDEDTYLQKESKSQSKNDSKNNGKVPNNKMLSQHSNEVFHQSDQVAPSGVDEMEIYAFCYFEDAVKLVDWQSQVLQTFLELNIPKNVLLVTEEEKCNGQFGMLLKLRSMKVICLQLLRINLYKNQNLKILFKMLPNPDSQIVFSKLIIPVKRINDYAFLAQDGQQCIVYNSKIEKSESENLEFKNYDFRNINENTRKLEEVITGMLNREEFENEQFYAKEKLSGKILLGVKDSTRQFVGSYTTNNHHESFFTFLAKRLRDCSPSISSSLWQREEYRLVIAGEEENQFYPLLDMKIFALNISKPAQKTIYQTSQGLYFQKIEEGNWPMSACLLYEKRQKNYIPEEKFKFALKQLDRRYFYVMAKMANQNALLDQQDQELYASQFP